MTVSLQSYNEILGKLARKIIADTAVNDLNVGSVLLTLLEAVATQDFENSTAILSVLETLNIDALKNSDLDARAADYGLARKTSSRATGFVRVQDSSIVKRATTLYAVKPAPIAGATKIYVNDASSWNLAGGTLFIGRGTQQFEGPITYTSIVNNGSFYTINLASALQKDHLTSDTVIDAQGTTDRLIPAGTVVKIPSNNLSPEVRYSTLRDSVLAAGEDTIGGISIVAENAGSSSNAGIGSIATFDTLPFLTALVSNTSVLSDGRDTESDDDLRERLKNYSATLSRGTRAAILSAIVGVSDSSDGKQVSSAVIQEPTTYGEPSIVYVDDGSGFQPTTQGQSVDVLLASASGGEQFLQLSNYPLPRPQVINQIPGPIELEPGMRLVVSVDEVEQEVIFYATDFVNIASATLIEIAIAINAQANDNGYNFRCRLSDSSSRLLIYPTDFAAEFIQVLSDLPGAALNANDVLKFPTNKYSYISLYKNNVLLKSKETAASLLTSASPWGISSPGTLVISVDGTPSQTGYFDTPDFGGTPLSAVSASQWASAINLKFAGLTASATSNGKIQIRSNKSGANSSLNVVGGTYVDDFFSGLAIYDEGSASDFALNRQTGNLRLTVPAVAGDSVTAGNADAKGYIISAATSTGSYDLSADSIGRPSEMVVVADGMSVQPRTEVSPALGSGIKTSVPTAGLMRIMCDTNATFQNALVGDYIYITYKALTADWFSLNNSGLFKIMKKGPHITPGTDSYVDVVNVGSTAEPVSDYYEFVSDNDVQVFGSDAYPQMWKAEYVSTSVPVTLQQMISSFDNDLLNVKGSIFKTSSLKATSTTENDGAIAIPVSVGKLSFIFGSKQGSELGNQSHVAARITSADMMTWFKRGAYSQITSPTQTNTILPGRTRYSDISAPLTASTYPGSDPSYGENLTASILNGSITSYDDIINITSGANKSHFRNVVDLLAGNVLGTRKATPKTTFDYLAGDTVELVKSLSFSSEDSIVFVLDGDAVNKTINVNLWRTGRVNSLIAPTNSQFSANDADNESTINFGTHEVWSTLPPINTNFEDYAVWFRSRNWYRSGGVSSSDGTLIVRAKEYGPIGDAHRFAIDYPSAPLQPARVEHANNPEYTTTTFYFESGEAVATGITSGTRFKVSKLQTIETTAQGAGSGQVSSGDYFYIYEVTNKAVVFWYAVDNSGSQPTVTISGVTVRYVKINTINTGDGAALVASKTALKMDEDESFNATATGNVISFFNNFNGSVPAAAQSGISFVIDQNTNNARYTFIDSVNLASVEEDQVMSIAQVSGISTGNGGTFSVLDVNITNSYIDTYNPYASSTAVGQVDKVSATSVVAAGNNMAQSVTVGSIPTTGGYFKLYDQAGMVVFWYDLNNAGQPQPSVSGANRYVEISTVNTGDSLATVASKTSTVVDADAQFSTTYTSGPTFVVTNGFVGPVQDGSSGTGVSFTFLTTVSGDALGGKYLKLYDADGSVAVWLNVNGNAMPPHGCDRAIQVILSPSDTASDVASIIAAYVDADPQFTASASTSNIYISNYYNGARGTAIDGTAPYATGFVVAVTQAGTNDSYDAPTSPNGFVIFPLLNTDVASIASVINGSETTTAAVVGSTSATIVKATKDELSSVSYLHNPDPTSGLNAYVRMFDGRSSVRDFANTNPNFVLKEGLVLQGLQPTIYDMASCPNPDTADVGEFFKLVPKTIKNVKHHMTHKALSQLPIVADVDVAGNFRKIQVKSKKLGTAGAVEVVGGRANSGELDLIGFASSTPNDSATANYLTMAVQAYPNTLGKGDMVRVYNTLPARRKFDPDNNTKIEVYNDSLGNVKYLIGPRSINYSPYTRWTIADVSASYGSAAGTVWRWAHNEAGAKAIVSGKILSYGISNINRVGGTATVTTSTNHSFEAGQRVVISGIIDVPSFNGEWTVLTPTTGTFTFASPGSNIVSNGGNVKSVAIQSTAPYTYDATSVSISSRIRSYDFSAGTTTVPFQSSLTVDSLPNQGDFFLVTGPSFNSPGSTSTFAVWFSIDGDSTAPTGAVYSGTTYKIRVNILSTDTINQIVSKISTALGADTNFIKYMTTSLVSGTSLTNVHPGDIVNVWPNAGDSHLVANWPMGNQSQMSGELEISGLPVLAVNTGSRYMDVINPNGRAMANPLLPDSGIFTGTTGNMSVSAPISTRFRLKHSALRRLSSVAVATNAAVASCTAPHGFSIGDSVVISDSTSGALNATVTVTSTPSIFQFGFATSGVADGIYNGNAILSGSVQTRYRISKLGFDGIMRIERTDGDSPLFADCGVCVDDMVEISGGTFDSSNRITARVLGVDNGSMIIRNDSGVEELNTSRRFNYTEKLATWTTGSNVVTGIAGTFKNVSIGKWVKSIDDGSGYFVQVIGIEGGNSSTATYISLGQNYRGVSGSSAGVCSDFLNDVEKGTELLAIDDLKVYGCDSATVGDSLVVDSLANSSWFNAVNTGKRSVIEWGSNVSDRRSYVMVTNVSGMSQTDVAMSVNIGGMYLLESESALYESVRQIDNAAISRFNYDQRILYATPNDRAYKMSSEYGTKVASLGKIGFPLNVATGIDGYSYYTGLMRTVQRIIDGYEPDSETYPGRRAVGSNIESLPPLIKQISMILRISTKDGVNLNDVTNDIKSAVIGYVSSLGVGEDVVLSEVIRRVKDITGVDAVTFTSPSPSLERIPVYDNEKALTSPDLISLS